ncbi:MAG: hypothetical protein ACPGED_03120 [Flavobacteriales bacterium]
MKQLTLITFFFLLLLSVFAQTTPIQNNGNSPMKLVFISNTAELQVNKMMEVATMPTPSTESQIQAFIDKINTSKSINPFDPEDLDIRATFRKVSKADIKDKKNERFGYFTRPFERFTPGNKPERWKHRPLETDHPFRARFTPKEAGNYECWIEVRTKNEELIATDTLQFTVQNSNLPGPISTVDNSTYFVRDGKSYFPVGQNMPWPHCDPAFDPICAETPCAALESYCAGIMNPAGFLVYHKQMEAYAKHGGNYFRMLIAPWNLDVEFEDLNNYYDRMQCAYELDEILNKAEELDLLIHLNLQVHYPLEEQSVYMMWHWDYGDMECFPYDDPYCYFDELGLATPLDFLKSEQARKHYQNRLRYLIARIGEHPGIGVIELLSEANNTGQKALVNEKCKISGGEGLPPYHVDPEFPGIVSDWHKSMSNYIKEDLHYSNHPIAVSYTGPPEVIRGDSSFYLPNVDVATWNYYTSSFEKFGSLPNVMTDFQTTSRKDKGNMNPAGINKPFLFSEFGPGSNIELCDHDLRFIKTVWMSSFSGMSGSGMNWSNQTNMDLWSHLQRVDSIISRLDLIGDEWSYGNDISKNKLADMVHLRTKKTTKRAMGVVNNRTLNFYTLNDEPGSGCQTFVESSPQYFNKDMLKKTPLNGSNRKDRLFLENMGVFRNYVVEWIDVNTGKIIAIQNRNTGPDGRLPLLYPTMDKIENAILFFNAFPKKSPELSASTR